MPSRPALMFFAGCERVFCVLQQRITLFLCFHIRGAVSCLVNACLVNACLVNACLVNACLVNACLVNACLVNAAWSTPPPRRRRPMDAAPSTLFRRRRPMDAAPSTLPHGRRPVDAAPSTPPRRRCPIDAAPWTPPHGRNPVDATPSTRQSGVVALHGAPQWSKKNVRGLTAISRNYHMVLYDLSLHTFTGFQRNLKYNKYNITNILNRNRRQACQGRNVSREQT